jgi:hypothetical protein
VRCPCPGSSQNSRGAVSAATIATIFIYVRGKCERNGKQQGGACGATVIDVRERRYGREGAKKTQAPVSAGPDRRTTVDPGRMSGNPRGGGHSSYVVGRRRTNVMFTSSVPGWFVGIPTCPAGSPIMGFRESPRPSVTARRWNKLTAGISDRNASHAERARCV